MLYFESVLGKLISVNDGSYRRRRWTYSFRAWIDERGSNEDRAHLHCRHHCDHIRLWDLNWMKNSHNIVRITRRRHPFHFSMWFGNRYWGVKVP